MSTTYNVEPPPTAKVLLNTTGGDILLELFAKQTPLASRNFLQHALDGYYTGTIFHRVVPGFVIQGGDPTATGNGGEAIYDGGLFADEFHPRLRFNRRGLLGMANSGQRDDNGSQFFLTLGKTDELNGTNTMFGRVVGDTLYNVIKMGEAELEDAESDRPMYPIRITGAEVLVNPFENMVARLPKKRAAIVEKDTPVKRAKKKGGKALLSFGDDEGGDAVPSVLKKPKFNPKLVSDVKSTTTTTSSIKQPQTDKTPKPPRRSPSPEPKPLSRPDPTSQLPLPRDESASRSYSSSPEPENIQRTNRLLEKTNAQIEAVKATMRRSAAAAPKETSRPKSALEQMIPTNSIRGRKRHAGQREANKNEKATMATLAAFRAKLEQAPALEAPSPPKDTQTNGVPRENHGEEPAAANDDDEEAKLCDLHFIANCQSCASWAEQDDGHESDGDDQAWMSHALSFEKDRLGKDLTWKKKNEEELVVIDPREKAKDLKEETRARKAARNGHSSRAWDRDRDKR